MLPWDPGVMESKININIEQCLKTKDHCLSIKASSERILKIDSSKKAFGNYITQLMVGLCIWDFCYPASEKLSLVLMFQASKIT